MTSSALVSIKVDDCCPGFIVPKKDFAPETVFLLINNINMILIKNNHNNICKCYPDILLIPLLTMLYLGNTGIITIPKSEILKDLQFNLNIIIAY